MATQQAAAKTQEEKLKPIVAPLNGELKPVITEPLKTQTVLNAEVKTFKQVVTDNETGVVVKNLYFLRIVRGNVTVQINVGEKTYTQIKTLTEEEIK